MHEKKKIDNKLLREYLETRISEGNTWNGLAANAGFYREKGRGDGTTLKRRCGKARNTKNGTTATKIKIDVAERICQNLGIDYYEIGL